MFEKLSFLEEQFEELAKKISDPEVIADQELKPILKKLKKN